MISLHEFGHFAVSKLIGVRVIEFSIGMGPAIFKRQTKETLYSLRILPIGGYCRLDGEDEASEDLRAFCNQKLWKRFAVVAAGAILNIILGFVLLLCINHGETTFKTTVIDSLVENSYFAESGAQPGDKIIKINGHSVYIYDDISLYTDKLKPEDDITVTVLRGGERLTLTTKASSMVQEYRYTDTGAEVTSIINGIAGETELAPYAGENTDELAAQYSGQTGTVTRTLIGIRPQIVSATPLLKISEALKYTGFIVRLVYNSLWDMITGRVGFEQVSGPVGIVSAINTAVNSGANSVVNVLYLTTLLTINLGVFNLLPLPALDGGRLLFMLIELFRKKPVPPEKEGMVHAIGLMLILLLTVVISFKDILALFG